MAGSPEESWAENIAGRETYEDAGSFKCHSVDKASGRHFRVVGHRIDKEHEKTTLPLKTVELRMTQKQAIGLVQAVIKEFKERGIDLTSEL